MENAIARSKVISALDNHHTELKILGVKSLCLFGSVARDEARSDSDIDFLVEFEQSGGLFQLLRLQHFIEDLFECKIDIGTEKSLREHLRIPIAKDVINVF